MHSFQNFIVKLIPNHPPPLEKRIWKLVVRALLTRHISRAFNFASYIIQYTQSDTVEAGLDGMA